MAVTDTMSRAASRMDLKKAELRALATDRRRRHLDRQVDRLKTELDLEREARQEQAELLKRLDGRGKSRARGTLRLLIVGGGAYLLGAKAGRVRYEQIMARWRELRERFSGAMNGEDQTAPVTSAEKLGA
jgi:hypothetical protein